MQEKEKEFNKKMADIMDKKKQRESEYRSMSKTLNGSSAS